MSANDWRSVRRQYTTSATIDRRSVQLLTPTIIKPEELEYEMLTLLQ